MSELFTQLITQNAEEPFNPIIFDYSMRDTMLKGFVAASGAYPTTNSSFPNATYIVFKVKKGMALYTRTTADFQMWRLRVVDSSIQQALYNVDGRVAVQDTDDITTGWSNLTHKGPVIVKRDCEFALMSLRGVGGVPSDLVVYTEPA